MADIRGRERIAQGLALVLPAVVLSYYAVRGASYDTVVWQQEAIAVWWVVGLGYLLGLLPRSALPRAAAVPLTLVVGLAALTLLAVLWTDSNERTVAEAARVAHYGGVLLLVLSLVDRRTWRQAAVGLTVAAVLVPAVAVASRLAPDLFPADAVNEQIPTGRLNYPLDYWNSVAAWSAMALGITLAWSAHATRPVLRALLLAASPLCGLAIYLTFSRGGVLSAVVAVFAVLLASRHRWTVTLHAVAGGAFTALVVVVARTYPAITEGAEGTGTAQVVVALAAATLLSAGAAVLVQTLGADAWRLSPSRARALAASAAATLAVAATMLVAAGSISSAWDEFSEQEEPTRATFEASETRLAAVEGERYLFWDTALEAFAAEPLVGIGPGTYEFWWNVEGGDSFVRDAHSLYLEQLAELGLPGLLLTLALLGSLLAMMVRVRLRDDGPSSAGVLAGLVAAFAVFLFHAGIDWLWESTAVTVLAVVAAGLAIGSQADRPPRRARRVRAGVAAVAIAACLIQVGGLIGTSRIRDSQAAYREGELDAALGAANDAVDAQPWAASPFVQRALLAESLGRLREARRDALLAVEREPTNWRHRLLLARIEARRGDADAALASYRRGRGLAPESVIARLGGRIVP